MLIRITLVTIILLLTLFMVTCQGNPPPTVPPTPTPIPSTPTPTATPIPSTPTPMSTPVPPTSVPTPTPTPTPEGGDDHGDSRDEATSVTLGETLRGVLEHAGDEDVFVFQGEADTFYLIWVGLDSLSGATASLTDSDGEYLAVNSVIGYEILDLSSGTEVAGSHYVRISGGVFDNATGGSYTLTVATDDHANAYPNLFDDTPTPTAAALGEAVQGTVDYQGDVDFFVFQAEEGDLYRIDAALGTLTNSRARLFSPTGGPLTVNDDYGDSLASLIYWEAPITSEYYVEVWGHDGTGTYTLTVDISDIDDDHPNYHTYYRLRAGSTLTQEYVILTVGESVPGEIDYDGDRDFFAFEAEAGRLYQIDVALGTLPDSDVRLYDAYGERMAYNDDYGDSPESRIVWKAPSSGSYYVDVGGPLPDRYHLVGGNGTGSYTLTVALSDIIDDHADELDDATATTLGEAVQGVLDYSGDVDVFAFEAEEGKIYQIDVALGTLSDSEVTLYDADGEWLIFNDDYGDSLASRILWEAPSAGSYYVEVIGFGGTGSYTLTIVTE